MNSNLMGHSGFDRLKWLEAKGRAKLGVPGAVARFFSWRPPFAKSRRFRVPEDFSYGNIIAQVCKNARLLD
jgi:hypothetical protein